MPLRSAIAAFHSLALTLARTAERSGASLVVGVSTAFTAETRPTNTQTPRRAIPKARASVEVLMIVSLVRAFPKRAGSVATGARRPAMSGLHWGLGVSAVVLEGRA